MAQLYSGGIITATGFKISAPQLIDDRCAVDLDSDLDNIPNKCKGLPAYSDETKSLWFYDGTDWIKVATGGDIESVDLQTVLDNGNIAKTPIWFPYDEDSTGYKWSIYSDPSNNPNLPKGGQFVARVQNDGYLSLYNNLIDRNGVVSTNTYFGFQSLYSIPKSAIDNTDPTVRGRNNTAFGYQPLKYMISGYGNTAFGFAPLRDMTDGADNTAIGEGAAGRATHVDESLIIGATAALNSSSLQDAIVIGRGAAQEADVINGSTLIGNFQHNVELSENEIILADGRISGTGNYGGVGFWVKKDGLTTLNRQTISQYNSDSSGKAAVTKEILNIVLDDLPLQDLQSVIDNTASILNIKSAELPGKDVLEISSNKTHSYSTFRVDPVGGIISYESGHGYSNSLIVGDRRTELSISDDSNDLRYRLSLADNTGLMFEDYRNEGSREGIQYSPSTYIEEDLTSLSLVTKQYVDNAISNNVPDLDAVTSVGNITYNTIDLIGNIEDFDIDPITYDDIQSRLRVKDENDLTLLNIGLGWLEGNQMSVGGIIEMSNAPNDDDQFGYTRYNPYRLYFNSESQGSQLTSYELRISDGEANEVLVHSNDIILSIDVPTEPDPYEETNAVIIRNGTDSMVNIGIKSGVEDDVSLNGFINLKSPTTSWNSYLDVSTLYLGDEPSVNEGNLMSSSFLGLNPKTFITRDGFFNFHNNEGISIDANGISRSYFDDVTPMTIIYNYPSESGTLALTSDITTVVGDYIPLTQKGANNGVATLDGGGKVPVSQLPSSVMTYEGVWDASTNSPTLVDGTGDAGMVYRVGTAGSQDLGSGTISFGVGDYVIYNGTIWEKSDTTDAVASVNGQTGIVSVGINDLDDVTDYTTANTFAVVNSGATGVGFRKLAPTDIGLTSTNSVPYRNNLGEFGSYNVRQNVATGTTLVLRTSGGQGKFSPAVNGDESLVLSQVLGTAGQLVFTNSTGDGLEKRKIAGSDLNITGSNRLAYWDGSAWQERQLTNSSSSSTVVLRDADGRFEAVAATSGLQVVNYTQFTNAVNEAYKKGRRIYTLLNDAVWSSSGVVSLDLNIAIDENVWTNGYGWEIWWDVLPGTSGTIVKKNLIHYMTDDNVIINSGNRTSGGGFDLDLDVKAPFTIPAGARLVIYQL